MKKLLCLLLCGILLIPMMASCQTNDPTTKEGTQELEGGKTTGSYPGETFTILCREDNAWGEYLYEISADEGETELVNQAVYDRNRAVEEATGLAEIKAHAIPGDYSHKDDFINVFKNSINAGTGDFDLIVSQQNYMADPSNTELFYNIHDIDTIKLNEDYYIQDIVEQMTINGQLKYVVSEFCLTYYDHAYVMYFNKTLANNNGYTDIYDLVKSGKWTIDKCMEYSRGIFQDTNNDQWEGSEDTYGYLTEIPNTTDAIYALFDCQPTSFDENGIPTLTLNQDKMHSIITKMSEFFATKDVYTTYGSSSDIKSENLADLIFRESRALFYPAQLNRAKQFRDIEVDFGIIPCPMWNEDQFVTDKDGNYVKGYYTSAQDGYSVVVVPADAKNPTMSGDILDALSYESKEKVIPAYYDEALKLKYSRDEDSAEMLDIIRNGFTVNFGFFYSESIGRIAIMPRILLDQETPNFMSYYAVNVKGYERGLKELLESYGITIEK